MLFRLSRFAWTIVDYLLFFNPNVFFFHFPPLDPVPNVKPNAGPENPDPDYVLVTVYTRIMRTVISLSFPNYTIPKKIVASIRLLELYTWEILSTESAMNCHSTARKPWEKIPQLVLGTLLRVH